MNYQDFELEISKNGTESDYIAKVRCPQGEAQQPFSLPDEVTLENLILKMRKFSRSSRAANCPEVQAASRFGELLFSNAFGGEISNLLKSCLDQTTDENGLRIKLILQNAPELSALPWEFLYLPKGLGFLAHFPSTPIVRYLQQATAIKPLAVKLPLKLLVVTASPSDFGRLNAYKEQDELENAVAELEQKGALHITWLEHATVKSFAETLKNESFHLLHFIGHSSFDAKNSEGALVLEDERGRGDYYEAMRLKALLQNHRTLRLVVLNSCEGAMQDNKDSFSSIAGTLMLAGIPAVIAMQFEISDAAAISFATIFYTCLAKGVAIDEAVGEARLHLFAVERNNVEWGTPVLYLRAKDGELFDVAAQDLPGFKNLEGLKEEQEQEKIAQQQREQAKLEQEKIAQAKIAQETAIQEKIAREASERQNKLQQEKLAQERADRLKKWKKYLTNALFVVVAALVIYGVFYGVSVAYHDYSAHQAIKAKNIADTKAQEEAQRVAEAKKAAIAAENKRIADAQAALDAEKIQKEKDRQAAIEAENKRKEEEQAALAEQQKQQAENQRLEGEKMFLQGSNYAKGEGGVKQDFKLACEWFKKAAEKHNAGGIKYAASERCKPLI